MNRNEPIYCFSEPLHLGNVLTTVSDIKLTADANADGVVDSYAAVITSAQDYYPFGSLEPGRTYSSENYRFGFNGKENDNEVKGTGNSIDFGARMYDSRLGRWLSLDPLQAKYPDLSPYNFCANNSILFIDPNGKEIVIYDPDNSNSEPIIYKPNMEPPSGASDFVVESIMSLNYLNNTTVSDGVNRVQNLVDAKTVLSIKESKYLGAAGCDPVTSTLRWNHNVGNEPENGYADAPIVSLAHEIDHASRSVLGWDEYREAEAKGASEAELDNIYMNKIAPYNALEAEEAKAISYENEIRASNTSFGNYVRPTEGYTGQLPFSFFFTDGSLSNTESSQPVSAEDQKAMDKQNSWLDKKRTEAKMPIKKR